MTMLRRARARIFSTIICAAAALLFTGMLFAPIPASATLSFSVAARTAQMAAIISQAGSSAKLKLYSGSRPSGVAAPSGNTLLATLTFGTTIGTATSGTLDFDEAGMTQNSASHVAGTPTFADITTNADVIVARIDIGACGACWAFAGSVVTGQNVSLTNLAFTAGNL